GDGAERCRFGRLPAGVGVDLGVEHQHVHVAAGGQDVVQAGGSDVVAPAVPADDPDTAPDQVIDHAAQIGDMPVVLVQGLEAPLQLGDPVELGRKFRLAQL